MPTSDDCATKFESGATICTGVNFKKKKNFPCSWSEGLGKEDGERTLLFFLISFADPMK
jgi:hypothetical protein